MTLYDLESLGDSKIDLSTEDRADYMAVRKALSADIVNVACTFTANIKSNSRYLQKVSPLVSNWVYEAAGTYARLYLMTEEKEYLDCLEILHESSKIMSTRWRVAGKHPGSRPNIWEKLTKQIEAYQEMLEMRNNIEMS